MEVVPIEKFDYKCEFEKNVYGLFKTMFRNCTIK